MDIASMWLMHFIKFLRMHLDRYPNTISAMHDTWNAYVRDKWRTFGPIHSMLKATDLNDLYPTEGMIFTTTKGFSLSPVSPDLERITFLIKRQTL